MTRRMMSISAVWGALWLLTTLSIAQAATCSMCASGETPFKPFATTVFQGTVLRCIDLFQQGPKTLDDCSVLQKIGETLCDCQPGFPSSTQTCSLCENNQPLPGPYTTVFPGQTCSNLEQHAKDDNIKSCPYYQGVIGPYCGCDNPVTVNQVCKLCGTGKKLPNPIRIVNGVSCLEREFYTSLGGNCATEKALYADACCSSSVTENKAPPQSGGFCFAGETSQVQVLQHDAQARGSGLSVQIKNANTLTVPVGQVKIGDYIQDGTDSFSRVYSFGHYDSTSTTEFLRLTTSSKNEFLELTPRHMVFTSPTNAVPAGSLQVGDFIMMNGDRTKMITSIQEVVRKGAYAPFTESGAVLVNDVLASSFVARTTDGEPITLLGGVWRISHHSLAHLSQAPHRLFSLLVSPSSTRSEGISVWIPNCLINWWSTPSLWVDSLVIGVAVCVLSLVAIVESFFRYANSALLVLAALLLTVMTRSKCKTLR